MKTKKKSAPGKLNTAASFPLNNPRDERLLRLLVIFGVVMLVWIYIWALILKLGREGLLTDMYHRLSPLTVEQRIMWDIVPFNYRGTKEMKSVQILETILNCFVFAPFAIAICYLSPKHRLIRSMEMCLYFSVCIETVQLLTMLGNPASEDLLTNTLGGIVGYLAYRLFLKRLTARQSIRLAVITDIALLVITVFAIYTTYSSAETISNYIAGTL